MTSTATSRLEGVTTSVAVKAPVRAMATTPINLYGLQTIDTVAGVEGMRVAVGGQVDQTENGFWIMLPGDWIRAKDFDGALDAVNGTIFRVESGLFGRAFYEVVTTASPFVAGRDALTFIYSLTNSAENILYDPDSVSSVADALRSLGAPPALLSERFYLTNYLSPAEVTDIATQTAASDVSAKMQQMVNEANGREMYLPEGGKLRISNQITRITNSTDHYVPGFKLYGVRGTQIDSRVNGLPTIYLDTTASFKFQQGNDFADFDLIGSNSVGGTGIYLRRSYDTLFSNVKIDNYDVDGIIIETIINDADSSNQIIMERTQIDRSGRWAINHNPAGGQNDLSYLTLRDCRFWYNGTPAQKAITGMVTGAVTRFTVVGHGFVNGQVVRIAGIKGPIELNQQIAQVTVIDANTIDLNISSTGMPAYVSDGAIMPRIPPSGTIRLNGQMCSLQDSWITESKNAAIFFDGDSAPSFAGKIENFTIENAACYSILCTGTSGLSISGSDLRCNQGVNTNYGHVLLDGTLRGVSGVSINENVFIHFEGVTPPSIIANSPHTVIDGIGTLLGEIHVGRNHVKQLDPTNRIMYGKGLFNAAALNLHDTDGAEVHVKRKIAKATYTDTGTYTPDVRFFKKHLLSFGVGAATKTITIDTPDFAATPGNSKDGQEIEIMMNNTSGGTVNLSWGFSILGVAAPSTIASAATITVKFTYSTTIGWVRTS